MGHSLVEGLLQSVHPDKGLEGQWSPSVIGRGGIKRLPQYPEEEVFLRLGATPLQQAAHQIHAFTEESKPMRFPAYEGLEGLTQAGDDLAINVSVLQGVLAGFLAEDELDGLKDFRLFHGE